MIFNIISSCTSPTPKDLTKENIIPKPVSIKASNSSFKLTNKTQITIGDDSEELKRIAAYFVQTIKQATGFELQISHNKTISSDAINLTIANNLTKLGNEGYLLTITDELVQLEANEYEGIFRGIQTIRQLFPPEIEKTTIQNIPWELATGTITDYPNYAYRGSMLDVSRHFFTVEEVKTYIDWLARYKMNVLHLHLTDDQGWRIEIKKWPNLTKIGGSTEVGGGKGGYYTQEQYKEIITYAKERYITIVPEIDMPGHINAALASYPELNCNNQSTELYTGMSVGFSSLCTNKEITYQFINDVIAEVASLNPGPYIHIGGDETNVTKDEDYIKFINRIQAIVASHGKIMIGWNEIATSDLAPNSVIQFWRKSKKKRNPLNKEIKLIMSPAEKAYLDQKYNATTNLGLKWAGYIEIDKAYNWNPNTYFPEINKDAILGIECPLWTETITNMEEMEFMVFPRLLGYAEIGWSPTDTKNWEDYKLRLSHHSLTFKEMGVNYYPSKLINWKGVSLKTE